ncbi:MAG: response regulator, partial [Candidatus Binataceae bacterium]
VFERFSQSDSSASRRHPGLGLGLAISRHLVEMHGGTIGAESPGRGQGARFTIVLPLRDRVAPVPQASGTAASETSAESADGAAAGRDVHAFDGLVVMIVDDDVDGRESLAALLAHFGARVITTGSAAETLAALQRIKPDLMVADIGLPDEDGYSLLRKVRALSPERGGRVPAVALTGFSREQDRRLAESAGFQRHLSKPLNIDELLSTLTSLVERPPRFAASRL